MKQLLIEAAYVMEKWWAKLPQEISASDKAVLARVQAAIDAPEQEPVATGWDNGLNQDYSKEFGKWLSERPGARQQVKELFEPVSDLTDDEIRAVYKKLWPGGPHILKTDIEFASAVLAAQKAKAGINGATPQQSPQ